MEKVGVEAIVSGLQGFMGDMGKMDKSIKSLVPTNTLLGRAFTGLGNIISDLAGGAVRILEFALGSLLASGIRAVITGIKDLISGAIAAGDEFQKLSLRLDTLNFNAKFEETQDFAKAQQYATEATKEQLSWLQKLANTTPYDNQDIANVYTLARSYSFADETARQLTEQISDFASGMGLGSTEIERIIVNLGQMQQQGKVTQREMNDLARGAFVPVNDIMKIMQEQTGLTGKEFDKFRNSGEGVNAFFRAFSTLVEQRFSGSAQKMARTFGAATDNAKDLVKSLLGLNVVKPILDVLGGRVADFMDSLNKPINIGNVDIMGDEGAGSTTRFQQLVDIAARIGTTISSIIQEITGLGPSVDDLADGLVKGFDAVADWLEKHQDDIVNWVKGSVKWIKDNVGPVIKGIVDTFNTIVDWVKENKGTIGEFFTTLGQIISDVFADLTGGISTDISTGGILEGIKTFMQYVIDNKDVITQWAINIAKAFVIFQAVVTIAAIIGGLISGFIGIIIGFASAWATLQIVLYVVGGILSFIGTAIAFLLTPIGLLILAVIALAAIIYFNWEKIKSITLGLVTQLATMWTLLATGYKTMGMQLSAITQFYWNDIKTTISAKLSEIVAAIVSWGASMLAKFKAIVAAIKAIKWSDIGKGIIDGIVGYVRSHIGELTSALTEGITAAITAAKAALQIQSPSKVFQDIGKNVMEGFSMGIEKSTSNATDSMRKAMAQVTMPALGMPSVAMSAAMMPSSTSTVNNTSNNNYNLNVNTQAKSEPIISDFAMLRSLGA